MEGGWFTDRVTIRGLSARAAFGVYAKTVKGFAEPPAGGIFGVARTSGNCLHATIDPPDNAPCTQMDTAISSLLTANNLSDQFAMCMPKVPARRAWGVRVAAPAHLASQSQTQDVVGVLTLGGTEPHYHSVRPASGWFSTRST